MLTWNIRYSQLYLLLERFSAECCKTKTKVITLANQNRRRQSNEPIRSQSKYMSAGAKRGKTRASMSSFVLVLLVIG